MSSTFATALVLSIASSFDNLSVGVAYAIKGCRIGWIPNAVISGANALSTAVTMYGGEVLARHISAKAASTLAACVFCAIGTRDFLSSFHQCLSKQPAGASVAPRNAEEEGLLDESQQSPTDRDNEPRIDSGDHICKENVESPNHMEWKGMRAWEVAPVATALCFTNVAGGVSAGLGGISIGLATVLAFIASFALLEAGQWFGGYASAVVKEEALGVISGILLVALGVSQVL